VPKDTDLAGIGAAADGFSAGTTGIGTIGRREKTLQVGTHGLQKGKLTMLPKATGGAISINLPSSLRYVQREAKRR
jgi:hypothetical protein